MRLADEGSGAGKLLEGTGTGRARAGLAEGGGNEGAVAVVNEGALGCNDKDMSEGMREAREAKGFEGPAGAALDAEGGGSEGATCVANVGATGGTVQVGGKRTG